MENGSGAAGAIAEFLHRRLFWLLIGAYVVAAVAPAAGLRLREAGVGPIVLFGEPRVFHAPALMLAAILFHAGLGVEPARLQSLVRRPGLLLAGLLANLLVPVVFISAMVFSLRPWSDPEHTQYILVGLALVASMPIAGSSTAWSQNADGDLALSLGLVVVSTILSPFTTPLVLRLVGWGAEGEFAECLHRLAAGGTTWFLMTFVMLPSLAGIGLRLALGGETLKRAAPLCKVLNSLLLLLLCYANAAAVLPKTVADPDWAFLATMLGVVTALCVSGFMAGRAVARMGGADDAARRALMFGLGMNNNGAGLVLAGSVLGNLPDVMLPVIIYNLVQHIVAAVFDRLDAEKSARRRAKLESERAVASLLPPPTALPVSEGVRIPPPSAD